MICFPQRETFKIFSMGNSDSKTGGVSEMSSSVSIKTTQDVGPG